MSIQERISVIIPNFNSSTLLCELLQSLKRQEYDHTVIEVIVIDDASETNYDRAARIAYPNVVILHNNKRRGPAYCKNRGILRASHEWLLFLDSDVIVPTNFLTTLIAHITRYPAAACFQPKILFRHDHTLINSAGGVTNVFGYAWDRGIFEVDTGQYNDAMRIFFASSAAMLMRRSMIERLGMFDAEYGYLNEDVDLGYRINMAGGIVMYVPQAVCYHRLSATMGRDNPTVKYLMERNRMMTVLKNYSWRTLKRMKWQFVRGKYEKYMSYVRSPLNRKVQYAVAAIKCWLWIVLHVVTIVRKRKKVQTLRVLSDTEVFEIMGAYRRSFPAFSKATKAGYRVNLEEDELVYHVANVDG